MYDNDGFFVLKRAKPGKEKQNKGIGAEVLVPVSNMRSLSTLTKSDRYATVSTGEYTTRYEGKAWQAKAWRCVSSGINFDRTPAFRKYRNVPVKLQHAIRIGLMVRCRGADPVSPEKRQKYERGPVIADFKTRSMIHTYAIADTKSEIVNLLEKFYKFYITDTYDIHCRNALRNGYKAVYYMMKAIVVYDDHTFDGWVGSPTDFFTKLELVDFFDSKGKVTL